MNIYVTTCDSVHFHIVQYLVFCLPGHGSKLTENVANLYNTSSKIDNFKLNYFIGS